MQELLPILSNPCLRSSFRQVSEFVAHTIETGICMSFAATERSLVQRQAWTDKVRTGKFQLGNVPVRRSRKTGAQTMVKFYLAGRRVFSSSRRLSCAPDFSRVVRRSLMNGFITALSNDGAYGPVQVVSSHAHCHAERFG
jgi:hypothetical protein